MSIKDLFSGQKTYKIATSSSMDTLGNTVESAEYLEAYAEDRQRFVPAADFGNPSQFAFFGSAEEYYRTTIERIHNTYPYDGSRKEKLQWHNSSSYLDNWFFDNEYPRTHGYVTLGQNQGNASLGSITAARLLIALVRTPMQLNHFQSRQIHNLFTSRAAPMAPPFAPMMTKPQKRLILKTRSTRQISLTRRETANQTSWFTAHPVARLSSGSRPAVLRQTMPSSWEIQSA